MTKEEAQIIIGNIPIKPEVLDDCYDVTEYQAAKDMAIKALEQQPILEKDGTLIVTTEHYENVDRVLVQHGTSGTLFYQDHEPCEEREQGKCPFYAS